MTLATTAGMTLRYVRRTVIAKSDPCHWNNPTFSSSLGKVRSLSSALLEEIKRDELTRLSASQIYTCTLHCKCTNVHWCLLSSTEHSCCIGCKEWEGRWRCRRCDRDGQWTGRELLFSFSFSPTLILLLLLLLLLLLFFFSFFSSSVESEDETASQISLRLSDSKGNKKQRPPWRMCFF